MSFKAVWGFDPEEVLKAQQMFVQLAGCAAQEVELTVESATESVAMPNGRDSQVSELRRMFLL